MRVGTYPWPGFSTIYYARSLGLLDPTRVELVDFDSAGAVVHALREHKVEAAGLALNEALDVARELRGLRVVLVFGQSAGGDVLLARPPIYRLQQLRGKRVGVETEAEGGYILTRVLASAGLKDGDVEVVDLSLDEHEQAYLSGRVDAVITMDPVRGRLLAVGANELFSSRQIAGELVDLLLVREGVPDTHARALQSLVNAHFRALDRIRANPEEAAGRLPLRFGQRQELLWSWAMTDFAGRGANLRLLDSGGLHYNADLVRNVMQHRGLIGGQNIPRLVLDPRFVVQAGG